MDIQTKYSVIMDGRELATETSFSIDEEKFKKLGESVKTLLPQLKELLPELKGLFSVVVNTTTTESIKSAGSGDYTPPDEVEE